MFNPLTTEILVMTTFAARLLLAVQSEAPATIDRICTRLASEAPGEEAELRGQAEALLVEFERLGLVESRGP